MHTFYALRSCGIEQSTWQQKIDILCYYVGQKTNSNHA